MRPLHETPAEPLDYALLNAAYGGLLATLAFAAGRRAPETEPLTQSELVPLGMATFALSRTIVHEKIETWLRRPFVEEEATDDRRPRGRRLRYVVGELVTCTRCTGTWAALALTALRLTRPAAGRTVIAVLASAGANDFLQAGFTGLCATADRRESADAGRAAPVSRVAAGGRS